ncbi:shufflon system plasmid conjugative transfer pilus tip adhesin PilV [Serratia quinivorans]|uniref:shufflon system plasmid conjugative transfer pilus tip adhesin PilV n=1 Tax=Serratia quinivorans TaxID=137545 RepID=UPI0021780417|nr:shufflon system plasmid conjugative transfer pilus tip adhesin PilV [Serratia quinivorans]CAI1007004.1 Type II secretory pathway, component PulJ [Serratia quinivorans]CAI1807636.1 Type II secretory pathway, component PulJ [Serratia quinivorans]
MKKTILVHRSRGFTLLEMLVALVVLAGLLALAAGSLHRYQQRELAQQTGQQMLRVSEAFARYVQDNYSDIETKLRAGNEVDTRIETLVSGNYLPAGSPQQNLYGQRYQLLLAALDNPARLRLVTLSWGGDPLTESQLPLAAAASGPQGGYLASASPDQISGVRQGWTLPRSALPGADMQDGHLLHLRYLLAQPLMSGKGFLRRDADANFPAANQMNNDLDMQFNQLRLGDSQQGSSLAAQGVKVQANGGEATLGAGSLSLSSGQQSLGLSAGLLTLTPGDIDNPEVLQQSGSEVSSRWLKPAHFTLPTGLNNQALYQRVDNLCQGIDSQHLGRLFVVNQQGSSEDRLYLCGQPDHMQKGSGRAFMLRQIGNNSDQR